MYCYLPETKNIWQKLISKSHCEKLLPLFGVRTISELKSLFSNIDKKRLESVGYRDGCYKNAPSIFTYMKISDIATIE